MSRAGITPSVRKLQFANGTGMHTELPPEVNCLDSMTASTPVRVYTGMAKDNLGNTNNRKARRRQNPSQS